MKRKIEIIAIERALSAETVNRFVQSAKSSPSF